MSWRPSRLSGCAFTLVALGLCAIVGDGKASAAEPTTEPSKQAAANDGKPVDPQAKDAPIELKTDTVIARIGPNERILLGDILADVYKEFAQRARRVPPEEHPRMLIHLIHLHVRQLIPLKVMLAEVRRKVLKEDLEVVWKQVEYIFDHRYLPILLEEHKLDTAAALDAQLKSEGSSLEEQKQKFVESQLAQQFICDHTKVDESVHPDELHAYYQAHYDEYKFEAKVRWEQLLVKFAGRTKQEARRLIGEMSDQVRAGAAWETMAKASSEGATAAEGGKRDWTSQGSLKFAALDQALFELPVGVLSPILENEDSVQIVRVVERKPASVISFEEKEDEIRKRIVDERIRLAKEKFIRNLLEEYRPRVWTVFDEGRMLNAPSPRGP